MGIPKFFRFISERYPLCSQLIEEHKIPEFDNLYLDMNGIIHACSHPSEDVHFRLTEDQIFLSIFNYIDILFAKIKPKKLFFMAVDGVAPRAKMNQQRARRFRTAKDSEEARQKALAKGQDLPKEPPFDSNCITPGTEFMCKLSDQLKYFVHKKITEDAAWRGVQIVLSGHEVPGEGEHKIMEYLRLSKSDPHYDSNIRHCLYGLDADLIMLGLLSHEPHFALLREEVSFGRKKKTSASGTPENQNFYLMHLSLLREYLNLEFVSLKDSMPFEYDLERIIDDFVFMAYFVGNDFLPNLPGLHINEGALAILFRIYKKILPDMGGYLNEHGHLNLERTEKIFEGLAELEKEQFETEQVDSKWMKGKKGDTGKYKPQKVRLGILPSIFYNETEMTDEQRALYELVREFIMAGKTDSKLLFSSDLPARDRAFLLKLAKDLGIGHIDPAVSDSKEIQYFWDEDEDEDDEESYTARERVLKRYDDAEIISVKELAQSVLDQEQQYQNDFNQWKKDYYKEKLEFKEEGDVKKLVFHYVEGLQWVLSYYYEGVPSWEWFYPYHYAPKITDLKNLPELKFKFRKGKPFKPFEQLMGVLPAASKVLIPDAFRDLMTDPHSPIIDFYPVDFATDLNGKKSDWEAIVKIPFIDETRLLKALAEREKHLTKSEKARNSFGDSFSFQHDSKLTTTFPSSLPGIFPDIHGCTCRMTVYNLPTLGIHGFKNGLMPHARLGVKALPGFPTLETIPYTAAIGFHGVNVFNTESLNPSMVVSLKNVYENQTPEQLAKSIIYKIVYIGWPYLSEAKVMSITDDKFRYNLEKTDSGRLDIVKSPLSNTLLDKYYDNCEKIENHYSKRYGTVIGPVEILVNVRPLKGMKLNDDGSLTKDFDSIVIDVPIQIVVMNVDMQDPRYVERPPPPLQNDFPVGSNVFFLGTLNYGTPAEVAGYVNGNLDIKLLKSANPELQEELHFPKNIIRDSLDNERYTPSYMVAKAIKISSLNLSRITASLQVISNNGSEKMNIGLNLKFDGKQQKVLGMSRKKENGWEFSDQAIDLLKDYRAKFPEIFQTLERVNRSDIYQDTNFYEASVAKSKFQEIKEWLKENGARDFIQIPIDSQVVGKDVIKRIESELDRVYKDDDTPRLKPLLVKNVPRQAVLKPEHAPHRLSKQTFELGDRVIHAYNSGVVPLAAKGTVIGIEGKYLDVLFDKTFMGGSSLNDRCSMYRGMTVKKEALLNLTKPQVHSVSNYDDKRQQPQRSFERKSNQALHFASSNNGSHPSAEKVSLYRRPQSAAHEPNHNAWQRPESAPARNIERNNQVKKEVVTGSSGVRVQILKRVDSSAKSSSNTSDRKETETEEITKSLKTLLKIDSNEPTDVANESVHIAQQLMSNMSGSNERNNLRSAYTRPIQNYRNDNGETRGYSRGGFRGRGSGRGSRGGRYE